MTIQIKAFEPCFPVVLFNMINKAALTIDYVKKKNQIDATEQYFSWRSLMFPRPQKTASSQCFS